MELLILGLFVGAGFGLVASSLAVCARCNTCEIRHVRRMKRRHERRFARHNWRQRLVTMRNADGQVMHMISGTFGHA